MAKPEKPPAEELPPGKRRYEVISVYAALLAFILIVISFVWNFLRALPSGD
ncbi:MAG: hypothetical protein ACE5ER_10315 [Nitrospinaceae bacterium]